MTTHTWQSVSRRLEYLTRALKYGMVAFALVAAVVWAYQMSGPHVREADVLGLSPEQVDQRLGHPSYDPRHPEYGEQPWVGEATDGPLVVVYGRGFSRLRVEFKDGWAVNARWISK
jgi:hypothetical protein